MEVLASAIVEVDVIGLGWKRLAGEGMCGVRNADRELIRALRSEVKGWK